MCHVGDYLVLRTTNKIAIDICADSKENTQFKTPTEAAKLAESLVATAKVGDDYLVVKVVA